MHLFLQYLQLHESIIIISNITQGQGRPNRHFK